MAFAQRVKANDLSPGRITDRRIDEFIGICRAIADGPTVSAHDARRLDRWLARAPDLADEPLVGEIVEAVEDAFASQFSASSRAYLLAQIEEFVGGPEIDTDTATTLALDDPPPPLTFDGQRFCLSGTFKFGTRNECTLAIVQRGGEVKPIAASTNVLVIGSKVTESWKHSSYGNKVASAVRWRDNGYPIVIVSEDHWVNELKRVAPLASASTGAKSSSASYRAKSSNTGKSMQAEWDETMDQVHRAQMAYSDGEISNYELQQRLAQLVPDMNVTLIGSGTITQAELAAAMTNPGLKPTETDRLYRWGRRLSKARRMLSSIPWYIWPILLFALSFLYFSARLGR